ncbi:MAG: UDP-glucose 4-epimerase GalE [Clostridiales bacterium]|jgi:UDP-glucose 4-epimerase|nr:UDP-glucose 4-epimerase GalE [Clostridiales bacterium]
MNILVTGGAGYIGSHTCVELLGAGHDIVCLDNFSNAKTGAIGRIEKLAGREFPVCAVDLLDEPGVRKVFARERIDAVVHFAGLKAVGESVRLPLDYYHNNITGTLVLCRAMSEAGCRSLVFSSSATVYGMGNKAPFKEDCPLSATNPYGMTKLMIEQMLRDLHASDSSWRIALLRYFNPIGAHESGLLGESPTGIPNNLLPYIAQVATGRLPELSVYGGDYETPDGTGVRDYLHVVDLALGHLKALDYVSAHSGVEAINLGTGRGHSVLEVIRAFEQASGAKIPYRITERRPGDIAECYADASKAQSLLGWTAQRGLAQMCADSWRFAAMSAQGAQATQGA